MSDLYIKIADPAGDNGPRQRASVYPARSIPIILIKGDIPPSAHVGFDSTRHQSVVNISGLTPRRAATSECH